MGNSVAILYLMKVLLIQGAFFILYYFFLKNKTTYILNRAYLLGTLLLAFIIPFLEIPVSEDSIPMITQESELFDWEGEEFSYTTETSTNEPQVIQQNRAINYSQIVKWIYLAVALTLIARSIFHLFILQKLKKNSQYVERKWFKLFKTNQIHPFSFLSNIFIPNKIFGTNSFGQILEHECEHVRQYHSIDRLLVDFVAALLWFNPFMYLYRRALIEIHEYQADAAVIKKFPDPIGYQEILFSQLSTTPYSGLVSHFNFSTIKKRIVMINKQKNKRAAWAYFLAAPVTFFVILAFANKTVDKPVAVQQLKTELEKVEAATPESTLNETKEPATIEKSGPIVINKPLQDGFIPSILPLKDPNNTKIVSDFGMRVDPFDKKKKMHKGIDLKANVGSVVISTANGVVHQAGYHDKYGYYILVEHGDKFMTRYSQLSELKVKKGDQVKRSQEIGLSGNTGRSTGPHLHYEVVEVGVGHKDPKDFIKNHKLSMIIRPLIESDEEIKARITAEKQLAEAEAVAEHKERVILEEQARAKEMERVKYDSEIKAEEKKRELAEVERRVVEQEREMYQARLSAEERLRAISEQERRVAEGERRKAFFDPENITDDPIYILDGEMINEKEAMDLNPDLIEGVDVSRGKGALKKYGSKAEGGVIEIETKKKKDEKVNQDGLSKSENNRGPFKAILDVTHRVGTKIKMHNQERFRQKLIEAGKLIDDKKFILNASFLQGRQGERTIVFSDNYMMIDDTNFIFQTVLPNEVGSNGLGGVTAIGTVTSYRVQRNKKNGALRVIADVNTNIFGQGTVTFKVNGSGYETATFVNTFGQMITMVGSFESVENSYRGISSFSLLNRMN